MAWSLVGSKHGENYIGIICVFKAAFNMHTFWCQETLTQPYNKQMPLDNNTNWAVKRKAREIDI